MYLHSRMRDARYYGYGLLGADKKKKKLFKLMWCPFCDLQAAVEPPGPADAVQMDVPWCWNI